jgi:(p)ppGpp synthase/HD superfamily hydrolase
MEAQTNEDEMIPAVLHDIVEDTEITLEDLAEFGLTQHQLDTVDRVTKREGESYEKRVLRVLPNPTARKIKIADIKDNLELSRLKNRDNLEQKDFERIKHYIEALNTLGAERA